MTRMEEASNAFYKIYPGGTKYNEIKFRTGVRWADEHPQSPWISVEDRIPTGKVIVIDSNGLISTGIFCGDINKTWYVDGVCITNVTHWMPIPELPKGGEV